MLLFACPKSNQKGHHENRPRISRRTNALALVAVKFTVRTFRGRLRALERGGFPFETRPLDAWEISSEDLLANILGSFVLGSEGFTSEHGVERKSSESQP